MKEQSPSRADRDYLQIMYLAAQEGESRVEEILRHRLKHEESLDPKSIQTLLDEDAGITGASDTVEIAPVDLHVYDRLMDEEVSSWVH